MKKGFTLVELAIVLVIIGLLIGGILAAQTMISTAKVQGEIRKLTQWSIAFTQFRQKFKQEAGDSNITAPVGNNNGSTSDALASCAGIFEVYSAWSQLSLLDMLGVEKYTWDCTKAQAYNFKGVVPVYTINGTAQQNNPYSYNYSSTGQNFGGKKYFRSISQFYAPETVLTLEAKLDDGTPSASTGGLFSSSPFDTYDCTEAGVQQDIDENFPGDQQYRYCNVGIYFSEDIDIPLLTK